MKIEGNKYITDRVAKEISSRPKTAKGQPETTKATSGAASDSVSISSKAKLLSKAKAAYQTQPEIRDNLVTKIRDDIEKGEYNVPASAIASRMTERLRGGK